MGSRGCGTRGFTEVLAVALSAQPQNEQTGDGDDVEAEADEREGAGALVAHGLDECRSGQPGGQGGLHGPDRSRNLRGTLVRSLAVHSSTIVVKGGIEALRHEREDEDDASEDFARAALRHPALDPGEDGAREQDIEEDKKGERDRG